jgi:hypothetical protein
VVALCDFVDAVGACLHASATVGAEAHLQGQLPALRDAFGIVAPKTAKRTALEEHSGSNAGSVMQAASLNVENAAGLLEQIASVARYG